MSTSIDNALNHFQFLGYTTEIIEPTNNSGKQFFFAKHPQKNNIVFLELFPSFLMFRVNLTTERKFSPKMDAFINKINKIFSVARMYYDIENEKATIRIEAVYTGEYVKESFGAFIEIFCADQNMIYQVDDFGTIFLGADPVKTVKKK